MIKRIIAAVVALCAMTAPVLADSPFDPILLITSKPAAWWDASYAPSITLSGSNVTAWADRSGNGTTLTQGTGALQPTYTTNCQNGLSCLTLSSQYMTKTGSALATGSSASTIFTVAGQVSVASRCVISYGTNATGQVRQVCSNPGGLFYSDIGGTIASAGANWSGVSLGFAYFTNTNIYASVNGSTPGTTATGALNTVTNNITMGGFSQAWIGTIEEVIVYNTVFTQAQRQLIEGALAWKWGIQSNLAAGHPYKTIPPSFANSLFF